MSAAFWQQVEVLGVRECWRWQGAVAGDRGVFKGVRASRYAWSFAYGEIPAGLHILHSCDIAMCVNPRHLRLGTQEDNVRDATVLSRVRDCLIGVPSAVDPTAMREKIRSLRVQIGMTQGQLAARFGMQKMAISNWERGRSRPNASQLPVLAEVLGVTVSSLFDEAA